MLYYFVVSSVLTTRHELIMSKIQPQAFSRCCCDNCTFFFCLDTAVTAFTSKPSDLTLVEEKKPVTLVWDYTLGGSITVARFLNVTGGGNERIASRSGGGNTSVVDKYQDRFEADISNTQARLTILTVQRSDQGKYEFDLLDVNVDNIKHTVEVIVQCKYMTVQIVIITGNFHQNFCFKRSLVQSLCLLSLYVTA